MVLNSGSDTTDKLAHDTLPPCVRRQPLAETMDQRVRYFRSLGLWLDQFVGRDAAEQVRLLRGYLQANAHRLDYPAYVAQGLPIGSGVVKAEVKVVVNQRAKRSGMRLVSTQRPGCARHPCPAALGSPLLGRILGYPTTDGAHPHR